MHKRRITVAKAQELPAPQNPTCPPPPVPQLCFDALGKRCAPCGGPISVGHVRAGERLYHRACFVCSACRTALRTYYADGAALFCPACYRQAHPFEPCARCGQPIVDESLLVDGARLHRQCFVCARCRRPLGDRYVARGGSYYCPPDTGAGCYREACQAELCAACSKPLGTGACVVDDEHRQYHRACFVCAHCNSYISAPEYFVAQSAAGSQLCCAACSARVAGA